MNNLINAEVVATNLDDYNELTIPEALLPSDVGTIGDRAQMEGSSFEKLCELAGRACYDSLGIGRSSESYWEHIKEVGHFSILEHANFTIEVNGAPNNPLDTFHGIASLVSNWPSTWTRLFTENAESFMRTRLTVNLRHAMEAPRLINKTDNAQTWLAQVIQHFGHQLAPSLVPEVAHPQGMDIVRLVPPTDPHEVWVSMYCSGSRGWSHELVRHGDWTAISQRSTRYVDESAGEWCLHPLLERLLAGNPLGQTKVTDCIQDCREQYDTVVQKLSEILKARGLGKTAARKQARGAARGLLGNALHTEMIFSASVAQWHHIFRMRASDAADAEIREWACKAIRALQQEDTDTAPYFADLELRPASDGIGECLVDAAHR